MSVWSQTLPERDPSESPEKAGLLPTQEAGTVGAHRLEQGGIEWKLLSVREPVATTQLRIPWEARSMELALEPCPISPGIRPFLYVPSCHL